MVRVLAVLLSVLLCSAPARAEEPTRGEAKFMRTLVKSLDDDSEDVRQAAHAAFLALRHKGAHFLVREIKSLKGARLEAARAILVELGPTALQAIQELEKPSAAHRKLLDPIRDVLEGKIEVDGKTLPPMANLEEATRRIAQARREGYRPILRPSLAEDADLRRQGMSQLQ